VTLECRTFELEQVGDALVFMRQNMSLGKVQLTMQASTPGAHGEL
jgi:hypothetical protein